MMLTIVEADISGPSSESFLSSEETERIQAVVEVHVDDRLTEFDRTLNNGAAVVGRSITDGESSTVEPLRITS